MTEQVEIDEVDVKILKTLLKDARTSFAEIARDCGLSTNAIVRRFYRLKRTGVIAGTSLIVDIEALGYEFALSIEINIDKSKESPLVEALKKMQNIFHVQQQIGKFDLHTSAFAKNLEEINKIRNLLKKQKGIKSVKLTASTDKRTIFPENFLIQPTGTRKNGQN
jgi:Lrp/AsnC family transcriptional regulator for asnA, asnC and gidA